MYKFFQIGQWFLNLQGMGLADRSIQQWSSSPHRKLRLRREGDSQQVFHF